MTQPADLEGFLRRFAGPELMERMGRMDAWALRGVLAMLDGEPDVVDAVLECIAEFDDQPGRKPLPDEYDRWEFACNKSLAPLIGEWTAYTDKSGGIPQPVLFSTARTVLNRTAPEGRRQAALAVLDQTVEANREGRQTPVTNSPELALFFMAIAAAIARQKKFFPVLEPVRLFLQTRIREKEQIALGMPAAERIVDVSDADAFAFLEWMYDETYVSILPKDPAEWTLDIIDMMALVKNHLLEVGTPEATTAEQKAALNAKFIRILKTALAPYDKANAQRADGRPGPMQRRPTQAKRSSGKKKRKR